MADYPKWILTDRRSLCDKCFNFVDRAWLFFISPSVYVKAVCESCADKASS
jgi:hypothetical protein